MPKKSEEIVPSDSDLPEIQDLVVMLRNKVRKNILNFNEIDLILKEDKKHKGKAWVKKIPSAILSKLGIMNIPDEVRKEFNERLFKAMLMVYQEIEISGLKQIDSKVDKVLECIGPSMDAGQTSPPKSNDNQSQPFIMPHLPNPNFVGREDELKELHNALTAGETVAVGQVAAATGLGGIGKTQLAVMYVYKYRETYPGGVFWINAEDPATISEQVAACGGPRGLCIPGLDAMPLKTKVESVRALWRGPELRLLVLDNVVEPEVITEWCPKAGGCRLLVTSRRENWSKNVMPVRISTLPRHESIELLRQGRPKSENDKEAMKAANDVCDVLGDLPLAVDLAGKYLGAFKNAITIPEYLEELKSQDVLSNPALVGDIDDPSPTKHLQNVGATFELSWKRLDNKKDELALEIFHLAGHFAPVSINRSLLIKSAGLDTEKKEDKITAVRAFKLLASLGLVIIEDDGRILLHRLLGAFARSRPGPGQKPEDTLKAVCYVMGAFASDENKSGLVAGLTPELPHLRHIAQEAERKSMEIAGCLFHNLGKHLNSQASYREAIKDYEKAHSLYIKFLDSDNSNIATALNDIAEVFRAQGDYSKCLEYHEKALKAYEDALGPEHPFVATSLNNIGGVLGAKGDLDGALAHYERSLAIYEKVYGKDHPDVAIDVNNIGGVLRAKGDLDGALAHYERSLAIDEKVYGKDHPHVAIDVNNIGAVLQAKGDLDGALAHYERSLAIYEKVYGKDHPHVAIDVNNIGSALQAKGDLDGALAHFKKSLAIDEKVYGKDHPKVAIRVNNIGAVLRAKGDLGGALAHYERSLAIDEKVYGKDHPTVAIRVNNIGSVLLYKGDLDGALAHYKRALAIFRKFLGDDHPSTKTVMKNLSALEEKIHKKAS